MITMNGRPRQTGRQTDIMAIAQQVVLTNASRANYASVPYNYLSPRIFIESIIINNNI